jgi:AcrR family transcriptional regulator
MTTQAERRAALPRAARQRAAGRRASGEDAPAERAQRLLDAAEQVFGERTYRGSTVAGICAAAGIATGSFYAHFGSKAELFTAVVRRISTDARAAMRAAIEQTDGSQREIERAGFRAFFEMLSSRPWIYRIVRESEFVVPGLFQEYYESLARGYARGVRRAQLSGEIDPRYDPEVIAYVYAGIGYAIGMRWAEWTAGGRIPADVLDEMLDVLARGLPPVSKPAG